MTNTHPAFRQALSRALQWSLLALIFIIPFNEGGNGYIIQAITQTLLLACATFAAAHAVRSRHVRIRYTAFDGLVLAGLAWIAVSLLVSDYRYATMLESIKALSYAALWCLGRLVLTDTAFRARLLYAVIGSGGLQIGVALYRRLFLNSPGWQAGFVNPNELACFLVFGLHIAISWLLFHRSESPAAGRPGSRQKVMLALLIVSVGMACFMLVVLESRGAFLSVAITVCALATLRHRLAAVAFIALLTLAILLPVPGGSALQRLAKRDDPFAYQRLDIWRSSLRMLADHPLFGVGLGMFSYYGPAYNFPVEHQIARYGKRLDLAHNDLLHVGAELGIVGLLLLAGGMACLGFVSVQYFRQAAAAGRPPSWQVIAASAGLLGFFINGLVSNLLLTPALAMTAALLAAVLLEHTALFREKSWSIPQHRGIAASWYGAIAVAVLYILVPVIGYPFWAHHHFLQYQRYRRQGALAEAVGHLHKAIRYIPMQAYYHQAFGNLYAVAFRNQPNLDAYSEAYVSLTEAIRHNPREAQFHLTLAGLHRTMFQTFFRTRPTVEPALEEYARALAIEPFNPFIQADLATLYADIGEMDQAIAAMQQAIQHEPNFVRGYQLLGQFLRHRGRESEAEKAFATAERILEAHPVTDGDPAYTRELLRSL